MRELDRDESAPATRVDSPGERIAREIGILAGRMALLLGRVGGPDGALVRHQALLDQFFASISEGRPLDDWEGSALDRPMDPPHPLDRLASGLRLSPFEVDLLLLAGMPEHHEGLSTVLRALHPRGEPRASVALAAQLLCRSSAERLLLHEILEAGGAVRAGVVRPAGDAPLFERSLLLAEALWPALHGFEAWPSGLIRHPDRATLDGMDEWLARPDAALALRALRDGQPCTVLVSADHEEVAFHRAAALAAAAGVGHVRLTCAGAWTPELVRLACAHALARGAIPVLRFSATEGPGGGEVPTLDSFPVPVLIAAREGTAVVRGVRTTLAVAAERLAPPARRRAWAELLPELEPHAPTFATRYPLEPALIREVADDVRRMAGLGGRPPRPEDVGASVRTRVERALPPGVRLIHPVAGWSDLVLAPDRLTQLHEAVDRLSFQARVLDEWGFLAGRPGARGVRMLLSGPPGTGKTLSAEVLARALGVDLLLVDISRLVSKWIGETEKNLAEVFDAAERSQAVLLFDEADGLFGRRSEVSDAHDRYANLETAYLLSRLERFEGLAVLSTNLRQNIDPAFIRRLEFVVDFDEPTLAERHALWRCHLPPGVPLAPDVDLAELATLYPIVGGLIRNAAVAAAFLAASQGTPLTRHHLVRAVRREYEKSGRAFPGPPAGMTDP